jgi:outer membrane protein OmpA-like peptidoglycan-associated protein
VSGEPELKDDQFPALDRDLPKGRGTAVVRTANAERRLDPPQPDDPAHDYTGRYLGEDDPDYLGGHPHLRLLVNQAGTHVQALLVTHHGLSIDETHLMGDVTPDGDCALVYAKDPARAAAHLEPDGKKGVHLTLTDVDEPGTYGLRRYDPRPTYFPHVFEDVPAAARELAGQARALELWPLYGPLRDRRLKRLGKRLKEELTAFFAISGTDNGPRLERNQKLRDINDAVGDAFAGLHANDAFQLEQAARAMVSTVETRFDGGTPKSYRFWLVRAIQQAKTDGAFDPTFGEERKKAVSHLVRRLGIDEKDLTATFKATLVFDGISTPGSKRIPSFKGYIAELELTQVTPEPWTETYTLWFAGVGYGASVGESVLPVESNKNDGTGESAYAWLPEEVTGWVSLAGIEGSLVAGMGTSKGVTTLIIQGASTQTRPLVLDMSDLDLTKWEDTKHKAGAEAGVEASVLVGRVIGRGKKSLKKKQPPEEVTRPELELAHEQRAAVHFETLGSAVLTPDARQLLRILAALELPAFMEPSSRLAIIGHTDRVDTWDRNLWLAYFRVQNARRALQDILGKRLRIGEKGTPKAERRTATDVEGEDREWLAQLSVGNLSMFWLGELLAIREGQTDREPNVKYRRVDLVLNHQVVLQLVARAP